MIKCSSIDSFFSCSRLKKWNVSFTISCCSPNHFHHSAENNANFQPVLMSIPAYLSQKSIFHAQTLDNSNENNEGARSEVCEKRLLNLFFFFFPPGRGEIENRWQNCMSNESVREGRLGNVDPLGHIIKRKKKKRGNSLKTNSKPVKGHAFPLNFIFA